MNQRADWEIAIARKNVAAKVFWRNVLNSDPKVNGVQEIDRTDKRWNGPILRFAWNPENIAD